MQDERIRCIDCEQSFMFPVNKQKVFASKGWPRPKRCPKDAAKKRAEREQNDRY